MASSSVNGTAVLAEMFEQAGHKVFSWRVLSPRLQDRADCIVWFPNDFDPPDQEVREWLQDWLYAKPNRTLIYVGRDFDAEPWYWEHWANTKTGVPKQQLPKIRVKKTDASLEFRQDRADLVQQALEEAAAEETASDEAALKEEASDVAASDEEVNDLPKEPVPDLEPYVWFTVDGSAKHRTVRTLQSDDPLWRESLDQIDASQLEIELNSRIHLGANATVLLESEGDALIGRDPWDGSNLIVVANGSFLLNLPLVNHEHRKLASMLIDEVGPPSQTVVFLESYAGGPRISDEDPSASMPTGLEIAVADPTRWIFLHLAVVGVIFCISRWPIFGLPRELAPGGTSDFGKHVHAMGELLKRSRDRSYAMTRFLHYQQTTKSND
ncbi:MAG: DUF4350 domain-containing protein [Thermoguttaceae bacterium]